MSRKPPQEAPLAQAEQAHPLNPDPFGWEAKRRRQQAEFEAEMAAWAAEAEATAGAGEDEELIYFTENAHRILFALVTVAADPASSHVPPTTREQWAALFKIRPTQAADALRNLSYYGIVPNPKHPEPIPLDGLLRFLADKLKAEEPTDHEATPQDMLYLSADAWIREYTRIHEGGVQ